MLAMRLRDDWAAILKKAWSIRFIAVATVLTGTETALPIIGYKLPFGDAGLAAVTFMVVTAAFVSRLVAQKRIR